MGALSRKDLVPSHHPERWKGDAGAQGFACAAVEVDDGQDNRVGVVGRIRVGGEVLDECGDCAEIGRAHV